MKSRRPKPPPAPLPGQLDLFSMDVAANAPLAVSAADRSRHDAPRVTPSVRAGKAAAVPPTQSAVAPAAVMANPTPNSEPPHCEKHAPTLPPRKRPERKTGALYDVIAAAEHCGLSVSTLNKLRCTGGGPKFLKITGAAVRYDPKDLDAWIASRRRGSTSEK